MKKTNDFQTYWIGRLKDKEQAAEYLNAAIEDGDYRVFLTAIREVAESWDGFSKLAKATRLNRSNLYKMLSEKGRPEIQTLEKVLNAFGLKLKVTLKSPIGHLKNAA